MAVLEIKTRNLSLGYIKISRTPSAFLSFCLKVGSMLFSCSEYYDLMLMFMLNEQHFSIQSNSLLRCSVVVSSCRYTVLSLCRPRQCIRCVLTYVFIRDVCFVNKFLSVPMTPSCTRSK
uniref:Uncharacterized protein n=1 Tax=Cacopsylla melanoneura TaxID=428564 RepID=A0A8D8QTC1_9HEMI